MLHRGRFTRDGFSGLVGRGQRRQHISQPESPSSDVPSLWTRKRTSGYIQTPSLGLRCLSGSGDPAEGSNPVLMRWSYQTVCWLQRCGNHSHTVCWLQRCGDPSHTVCWLQLCGNPSFGDPSYGFLSQYTFCLLLNKPGPEAECGERLVGGERRLHPGVGVE